jgi:hypothetical protein
MKGLILPALAGLCLVSCSQSNDSVAGTIGTGNTAGVAGVAIIGTNVPAAAHIYLYKADSTGAPVDSTVTGTSGNFAFSSLTAGKYLIYADQNGQLGMLSDTLSLGANDVNVAIELKPYLFVAAGTNLGPGYSAVSANPIINVDSVSFLKVLQDSRRLVVVTASGSYATQWDSATGSAALLQGFQAVASDTVLMATDSTFGNGVADKSLNVGLNSLWFPKTPHQLHIGLQLKAGSGSGYPMDLVRFDDSTSVQLVNDSLVEISIGQASGNALHSQFSLTAASVGQVVRLDLLLDGGTGKAIVSGSGAGSGLNAVVSLGNPKVDSTSYLKLGSPSGSSVLLLGAGVELLGTSL